MSLKGSNNEEKIWNYLKSKGLNDYGISGLMGNLYAESALIPTNLQNSYEKKLGFTDTTYTNAVDNGTYNNFVKDSAGYGLAQWTYWSRKQNLLNFAKSKKTSIGNLEMQLDFLYKELSEGYKTILNVLKTAKSIREASDVVLLQYERPADQSEAVQIKRANYGEIYYKKYATTKLSTEEIAREVISGKWGNGIDRKVKLEAAGYNYSQVQTRVDELMKNSSSNTTTTETIKKGDKVKVINAITYTGSPFRLFYKEYDVIEVNKDRVVIGIGKTVTAAINIKNIKKI